MASYTFRWQHPASEVYVTGTFDDWSKSIRLERNGDVFEKHVDLPYADRTFLYKFVVDGHWTTDYGLPCENDGSGNVNNILRPEVLTKKTTSHTHSSSTSSRAAATGSSTGYGSSLESHIPGAFPETPAVESEQNFSVAPLPAMSATGNPVKLRPGESVPHHSEFTSNTVDSNVKLDEDSYERSDAYPGGTPTQETSSFEQTFSVNPIPATSGYGNPMELAAGESVPHHSGFTTDTIGSNVKLDKESYERSDAYPGGALPRDTTSSEQTFSVNPIPATPGYGNPVELAAGESVPHHSNFTSNTIGSNVKLDKESYERSDAYPSGATSQDTDSSVSAFSVAPVSGTMIPESSLSMGSDATFEQDSGPHIRSGGGASSTSELAGQVHKELRGVPSVVTESQRTAHASPEAAASAEAVTEKKEVEQELLSKVQTQEGLASDSDYHTSGSHSIGGSHATTSTLAGQVPKEARGVPSVVTESQQIAHASPEASASAEAVSEKKQVEQELLNKVTTEEAILSTSAAPTSSSTTTSHVPQVVNDSQYDAGTSGEASTNPAAVAEKEQVEDELKSQISETPATAESTISIGRYVPAAAAGVAATAAATFSSILPASVTNVVSEISHGHNPFTAAQHTSDTPSDASSGNDRSVTTTASFLPSSVTNIISEITHGHIPLTTTHTTSDTSSGVTGAHDRSVTTGTGTSNSEVHSATSGTTSGVPSTVTDSIREARLSPEATANPEAVADKLQVERELLSEIKPSTESGEPAPATSASLSPSAASTSSTAKEYSSPSIADHGSTSGEGYSADTTSNSKITVPQTVRDSIRQAHESPEATANPDAVKEKAGVERELLSEISPSQASGEPAPQVSTSDNSTTSAGLSSSSTTAHDSSVSDSKSASTITVPGAVKESIRQAHQSPEATANLEAVKEKAGVERELLGEISPSQASGEPAPKIVTSGSSATNVGPTSTTGYESSTSGSKSVSQDTIPVAVKKSIQEARQDPEAAANPEAVREKADVERELLSEVSPSQASGVPAPSVSGTKSTSTTGAEYSGASTAQTGSSTVQTKSSTEYIGTGTGNATESGATTNIPGVGSVISSGPLALGEAPQSVIARVFGAPVDSYVSATTTGTSTAPATTSATFASTSTTQDATSTTYTTRAAPPADSTATPTSMLVDSDTMTAAKNTGLNAPASAPAQSIATRVFAGSVASSSPETATRSSGKATTSSESKPTVTTGVKTSTIPAISTPLKTSAAPAATTSSSQTVTAKTTTAPTATTAPKASTSVGRSMSQAVRSNRQDSRDISPMGRGVAAPGASGSTDIKGKGWQTGSSTASPEKKSAAASAASAAAGHSTPSAAVGGSAGVSSASSTARSAGSGSPSTGPSASGNTKEEKKKKRQSFFGRIKEKLKG